MRLYQALFYDEQIGKLCSAEHFAKLLVSVEVALVKAQGEAGIIPMEIATKLIPLLEQFVPDLSAWQQAIPLSGNAAAPLVKQLIATISKEDSDAAKYIHLGATSQDIVDTATMLKLQAFVEWLEIEIEKLEKCLRQLSTDHRATPMIGRTLMQQARPITFGLKTANWLASIQQVSHQLASSKNQLLVIQLGGAVGSQNQYLTPAVSAVFAQHTGLQDVPAWHTTRVPIALWSSWLGTFTGCLGKIAADVILMAQTEVGEVAEPYEAGRGTSSTMPHKRNPVLATAIAANAQRVPFVVAGLLAAMPQAHERAAGPWHTEWEPLDELLQLTAGALSRTNEMLVGLEVNEHKMLENIGLTKGLVFAETVALSLAAHLGKSESYELVKLACQQAHTENRHLKKVLEGIVLPISPKELLACFKPENAIGRSMEIIDEILGR